MQNATAEDSSGKPDAWKLARPVWGWGLAVMPALHHKRVLRAKDGKPATDTAVPRISEKHKCLICGQGLVRRPGKEDGQFFWGCSGYPACRNTYPDHDGKPKFGHQKRKEQK